MEKLNSQKSKKKTQKKNEKEKEKEVDEEIEDEEDEGMEDEEEIEDEEEGDDEEDSDELEEDDSEDPDDEGIEQKKTLSTSKISKEEQDALARRNKEIQLLHNDGLFRYELLSQLIGIHGEVSDLNENFKKFFAVLRGKK